jgi:ATP-dependent DNA ligase
MFLAFDLLHRDGVDLRGLPLTERRRDLERLSRRARVPYLRLVETFPDGEVLFEHCNQFGFEGIVRKLAWRSVATVNSPPANLLSIVVALNPTISGCVAVPVVVAIG